MEITIKIQGLEGLVGAISNFATALAGNKATQVEPELGQGSQVFVPAQQSVQTQPVVAQVQQPVIQQQPVQQPVQAQQVNVTQPVTTTATNYSLDDISKAAMTLLDAGRQQDLLNLLAQFGVESLPALPTEQYGAFATALRGLGAHI